MDFSFHLFTKNSKISSFLYTLTFSFYKSTITNRPSPVDCWSPTNDSKPSTGNWQLAIDDQPPSIRRLADRISATSDRPPMISDRPPWSPIALDDHRLPTSCHQSHLGDHQPSPGTTTIASHSQPIAKKECNIISLYKQSIL